MHQGAAPVTSPLSPSRSRTLHSAAMPYNLDSMPTALPDPVLALSMDNVLKLNDLNLDQLANLWNVFTKCKESLESGRRLENLSWRLWFREAHILPPDTSLSDLTDFTPLDTPLISRANSITGSYKPVRLSASTHVRSGSALSDLKTATSPTTPPRIARATMPPPLLQLLLRRQLRLLSSDESGWIAAGLPHPLRQVQQPSLHPHLRSSPHAPASRRGLQMPSQSVQAAP